MKLLIELDGVLRGQNDEPISTGIILSGTLSIYNKISFFTTKSQADAERWLMENKIVDYDYVFDSSLALVGEDLKQRQFEHARSRGLVDVLLTNDPNLWAYAFNQGIPAIMFAVPSYTRPEFRPDAPKKMRAWNQIEEAIKEQNILRSKDVRVERSERLNFDG